MKAVAMTLVLFLVGTAGAQQGYQWIRSGEDLALFQGTTQIGVYSRGVYRKVENRQVGSICDPPTSIPTMEGTTANFGLDIGKIPAGKHYYYSGKESDKEQVFGLLGAGDGQMPDDSKKLRLTVSFDDEATRKKVMQDWKTHPAFNDLRDKILIQDYAPTDWAVAGVGYRMGITLTDAPGKDGTAKERAYLATYPGPEKLAEYLRKRDPNYPPNGGGGGGGLNLFPIQVNFRWDYILLGVLLIVALLWRAKP